MDALSPQRSPNLSGQPGKCGADHVAPDCAGANFYAIDRGLRDLLRLYLEPDDFRRLEPHFDRLGRLAGGRLDELARIADKHPPVLHPRDRFGRDEDWIDYHSSYREMEKIAFADFQFHAMSHRAGVLGMDRPLPAVAKYALQYLFVQAEFGLMCPISVTDTSIHLIRKFASHRTQGLSAAENAVRRCRDDVERHAVHDRAGRRLRRRRDRNRRPAWWTASGGFMATNGSARTPMPTSRCCWRGPKAQPAAPRGLRCSRCRAG